MCSSDLCLYCSHVQKTCFLMMWLIFNQMNYSLCLIIMIPVLPVPIFFCVQNFIHLTIIRYKGHPVSLRNANFRVNTQSVNYNMSYRNFNEIPFMRLSQHDGNNKMTCTSSLNLGHPHSLFERLIDFFHAHLN